MNQQNKIRGGITIKRVIKDIYRKIKEYDEIVIARHIGPDPDAIASEIALRDSILLSFPHKKVYAVGAGVAKFRAYGSLDKVDEQTLHNPLLIILDVPNLSRVDGVNLEIYKEIVKIDHHPKEDTVNLAWTEEEACSTCQMIAELILCTRLKLNQRIAENLYMGIVSDSDRFLLSYTSSKTLMIASYLIEKEKLDLKKLYDILYERPLNEIRFQAFLALNMTVTENGFAYIKISEEDLKKYAVDNATPSNLVNNFNFIKEVYAWCFITFDTKSNLYKLNIRSRGPIINEVASKYNGGGHKFACGARIETMEEVDKLLVELDQVCADYKNHQGCLKVSFLLDKELDYDILNITKKRGILYAIF